MQLLATVLAYVAMSLALAVQPANAAPDPASPRLALVVGNSTYTGLPPLPSCTSSAHLVTAALQRAGYTVTERMNESNGRMGAALSDFSDALLAAKEGAAVLYYCGYAVGFDGRVFLLPVSTALERPTDALTQGLVGRLPVNAVVRSPTKAGLILLDTVVVPNNDTAIPFASLIDTKAMDDTGFVAVRAATPPPDAPSTMATTLSAAFAQPNVELGATVGALQAAVVGPAAATLVAYAPPTPTYLAGAAPPPAPVAAPAAPIGAPPLPAAAASTPAVLTPADRRRAQLSLQRLGYFNGRVNGTFGADSVSAIRRYQTENGGRPSGQLTTEQLGRLLEDGR